MSIGSSNLAGIGLDTKVNAALSRFRGRSLSASKDSTAASTSAASTAAASTQAVTAAGASTTSVAAAGTQTTDATERARSSINAAQASMRQQLAEISQQQDAALANVASSLPEQIATRFRSANAQISSLQSSGTVGVGVTTQVSAQAMLDGLGVGSDNLSGLLGVSEQLSETRQQLAQQTGTAMLSIANQAPQALMKLFRG